VHRGSDHAHAISKVQGPRFKGQGSRSKVQGSRFKGSWVQGFKVQGFKGSRVLNPVAAMPSEACARGFRSTRCLSARMCEFVSTPRACVSRGKPKAELLGRLSWGYTFFAAKERVQKKLLRCARRTQAGPGSWWTRFASPPYELTLFIPLKLTLLWATKYITRTTPCTVLV
jgi:hypothetical protein